MESYVDKAALAKHLGVSSRTIDNMMGRNDIPYIKWGRAVRFKVSEVDEALQRYRVPSRADAMA